MKTATTLRGVTSILTILLATSAAEAAPSIKWKYFNFTPERTCWDECTRTFLGACVEWQEHCDYRSHGGPAAWSDSDKSVTQDAMNYLSQHIGNAAVWTCIAKRTRWYMGTYAPQAQLVAQAKIDFDALAGVTGWPVLRLTARNLEGTRTGQAVVERVAWGTSDGWLRWSGEPAIELNMKMMRQTLGSTGPARAAGLAGTIFHELLHQMGHTHPSTGSSQDYHQGHFIVVAGDCLASNGTWERSKGRVVPGSPLTDEDWASLLDHPL